jgi:hypothetical protein
VREQQLDGDGTGWVEGAPQEGKEGASGVGGDVTRLRGSLGVEKMRPLI